MSTAKMLLEIFDGKQKRQLFWLMWGILIGSFFELMGVVLILPFINVIMDPAIIQRKWYLSVLYDGFHFTEHRDFIIFLAAILMMVYILKNLFLCLLYYLQYRFTYDNRRIVATRMMDVYLHQPYSFHRTHTSSELMRNLSNDVVNLFENVLAMVQIITEVCVCIVLCVYLLIMDKSITIGVGLGLVLYVFLFYRTFKKKMNYVGAENRRYAAYITKWMQQSFGGIKETKILDREDYFLEKYDENYKMSALFDRVYRFMGVAPRPIMEMVCIVTLMLVIIAKLLNGTQSAYFVSTVSVFAIAAFRLLPSFNRITSYINVIMFTRPSLELVHRTMLELRDLEKQMKEQKTASTCAEKKTMSFQNEIRIENLDYRYPDGQENVLSKVTFTIEKNTSVALIGPSGAGKTTLADIILGVLDPTGGKILVDGIDVATNMTGWHGCIGYIPQNIYLMDDSIRENIAFGIDPENIDSDKFEAAIQKAQLKDFIDSLPDGADTIVGESGVRLSGGQRQRIGIARALYNDPDVLVLDEATSALDNDTEKAVMEAIDSLSGTKTLIIIAHRLTTIQNCDAVYEVKDGAVTQVEKPQV